MAQNTTIESKIPTLDMLKNPQRIDRNGRIVVSRTARIIRGITLISVSFLFLYGLYIAIQLGDPLIMFASVMPISTLILYMTAWLFFKSPQFNKGPLTSGPLVSVLIPVYN